MPVLSKYSKSTKEDERENFPDLGRENFPDLGQENFPVRPVCSPKSKAWTDKVHPRQLAKITVKDK